MDNKKNGIPKLRFPGFTGAWEQRKLGEVAKKITKGTTPHDKSWSGPVNYVKTESIDSNNGNISVIANTSLEEHEGYLKRSQLKENDVLFSIVGTLGRVGVVKKKDLPANTNQQICIIRPFEENSFFLLNALKTNRVKSFIKSDATIGAQPSLSLWQIEGLRIPFPNLEEQQKISAFFVKLDSLIALHQRKLEHLQEQKKGLLQKMFPKNGEIVPEVRFPGFTDAWEQRKLGEVVNFLDTLRKPLEGAKRVKGPYPYYGASGIVDYVDGYLFDEELILLSEDGANITERNYPVCFLASGKYWVNNHAHVLKIKEDNDNNFICNSLERKDYTKYNTGMAMPKLNKETCKGIPIMCPNYDEQKKIGNYFRKFDTLIALHQRKLDHLELMKKGLLQQMFV